MPITAWNCPGCKRVVGLDHYSTTNCGLTVCPADYAVAVLNDRAVHDHLSTARVSNGTGCPRGSKLLTTENVTVNPLDFNLALTGVAWHALMATADPATAEVIVSGTIDGVMLTGHIDRVIKRSNGDVVISDHKHGNDFARKYAELKPEYIVQVSIYAELYAQTFGVRPIGGVIWRHFASSPPFIPFAFKLWDVVACLAHKPYGGQFTVGELYHQAASGVSWRDLPLVGATMAFGSKSFCDYCEVRTACTEAATGAPF